MLHPEEVEAEESIQALKEVEIWKEAIGVRKKGKIYRLGLHGSTFKDSSASSQKSTDTSHQKSLRVVDIPKFKAAIAEVASKLEEVQKSNEEKEKEMERVKKENKRMKQKVNILFEKFNMTPIGDSDSDDDEDK